MASSPLFTSGLGSGVSVYDERRSVSWKGKQKASFFIVVFVVIVVPQISYDPYGFI